MPFRERLRLARHLYGCVFAIVRQDKAGFERNYIAANRIVNGGKFILPDDEKGGLK